MQVLFVVVLDPAVDLLRGPGHIAFDDVRERGTRVFGIQIDIAVEQRRVGDQSGPQIGPRLSLDAGSFQSLSVYLGDDELFRKVLATDLDGLRIRRRRKAGCDEADNEGKSAQARTS